MSSQAVQQCVRLPVRGTTVGFGYVPEAGFSVSSQRQPTAPDQLARVRVVSFLDGQPKRAEGRHPLACVAELGGHCNAVSLEGAFFAVFLLRPPCFP